MSATGRRSGNTMCRKVSQPEAPSIAAASLISCGTACNPARKKTVAKGSSFQSCAMASASRSLEVASGDDFLEVLQAAKRVSKRLRQDILVHAQVDGIDQRIQREEPDNRQCWQ